MALCGEPSVDLPWSRAVLASGGRFWGFSCQPKVDTELFLSSNREWSSRCYSEAQDFESWITLISFEAWLAALQVASSFLTHMPHLGLPTRRRFSLARAWESAHIRTWEHPSRYGGSSDIRNSVAIHLEHIWSRTWLFMKVQFHVETSCDVRVDSDLQGATSSCMHVTHSHTYSLVECTKHYK